MKTLFILVLLLLCISTFPQKHTFTKNASAYKNFITNETLKSKETDDITIINLNNGTYKIIDTKGTMIVKFSHIEKDSDGTLYYYNIIGKKNAIIKSGVKMSEFAKGIPGNFAIDSERGSIVFFYKLGNN